MPEHPLGERGKRVRFAASFFIPPSFPTVVACPDADESTYAPLALALAVDDLSSLSVSVPVPEVERETPPP